jgi:hypothetical protein
MGFLLGLGLLQGYDLGLGQHQPFLRHLGLERLQPFLDVFEVVTLPHAAHPKGRDRLAALLQLIRYPQLTPAWLLDRQFDHCRLDRRIHPVGQDRLCPADLLQRQLATLVVELLEPVKAVAAVTHHLAGLADPGLRRGRLLPSCLASSNRPTLARITFCACVIGGPQLTSSRRHLPQLDLPHRSLTIVRLSPYLYT